MAAALFQDPGGDAFADRPAEIDAGNGPTGGNGLAVGDGDDVAGL